MKTLLSAIALCIAMTLPHIAAADIGTDIGTDTALQTSAQFDVELDPLAFISDGHSVHVGGRWGRHRFDLGAFGAKLPEFARGHKAFDARFAGFGLKWDRFFRTDGTGAFLGAQAGTAVMSVRHKETGVASESRMYSAGLWAGWRFDVTEGLFVVPWVGVDRVFGAIDTTVGQDAFTQDKWQVFPTLHVGYRL